MAWFSLSTGHNGLYAQQVDTTTGAPVGTPSHLATSTDALIERTPIAARAGGGIDVAYTSGSNIDLWKIGPSGPGAPIVVAQGNVFPRRRRPSASGGHTPATTNAASAAKLAVGPCPKSPGIKATARRAAYVAATPKLHAPPSAPGPGRRTLLGDQEAELGGAAGGVGA